MDGEVFYLYRHDKKIEESDVDSNVHRFDSHTFSPFFSIVCKSKKAKDYNDFYTELRWRVASFGRLVIYYIEQDGRLAHTSFCTPKSFKFPFMKENDYHIGPCFTDEQCRGQALYAKVLTHIVSTIRRDPSAGEIYMIIDRDNYPSREGVKKAGFQETAILSRKGRLKKYYVEKWLR